MEAWTGEKKIKVVSACINANGEPDFAYNEITVKFNEYVLGEHYQKIEETLYENRYERPFVHFDEANAPEFLLEGVRNYLKIPNENADTRESTQD